MADTPAWAEFEENLYPTIRRNYPVKDGWKIEAQKTLKNGGRVDWVVFKGSRRIVIEAKDKRALELKDVKQVLDYRSGYKAQIAILYVANDTKIPDNVKKLCRKKGIKIRRIKRKK